MLVLLAAVPTGGGDGGDGSLTLLIIYIAVAIGVSFLCSVMEAVLLSVSPNKASVDGGTSITLSGSYMSSTHGVPAVCFGTQLVSEENISFTNSAEILVISPEWEGVSPGEEETVNLTVRNWLVNAALLETTPTSLEICSDDALTSLSGFSNQLAFTFKAAEAEARFGLSRDDPRPPCQSGDGTLQATRAADSRAELAGLVR